MQLEVRYFALFREQTGHASEVVDWHGGTVTELFAYVAEKHTSLQPHAAALVAVNDEMASWDTVLQEGDEVLFFPPVAGG